MSARTVGTTRATSTGGADVPRRLHWRRTTDRPLLGVACPTLAVEAQTALTSDVGGGRFGVVDL